MSDLRKEFEALPSIKVFLPSFKFNEDIGEYVRSGSFLQPDYSLGFLMAHGTHSKSGRKGLM
ncbi:MAG: hypothetical protein RSA09_00060 [Acinetobacter sp.]